MLHRLLVAANTLLFSLVSPAMVQSLHAQRGGPSQRAVEVVAPGTRLPEVTAYDEQGEKFSTASLRGSYTVLVFGCLT